MIPGKGNFSTFRPDAWSCLLAEMLCAYTRLQHHFPQSRGSGSTRPCVELENMAINTIIVDDEKPARDELAFLLKAFPEINLIGQGKNGVEAVSLIKEHSPDLVFLDVKMPGLDGFGGLKKLLEPKLKIPHVFFPTPFYQSPV